MSTTARQTSSDIVGSALAVAEASITLSLIGCRMQAATQLQEEQLDRIGAAVAEVSRSASALAAHASESAVIAGQSETKAKDGTALITAVTGDLEHAVEAATDSMQLIEGLSRRVEEVGALAATIDQIASRTKLLALNAAIEAARAGEHGRGFSVVAEEVGALALATSEAAGTIAEIVGAIQQVRGSSGASSEAIRQSTERMAAGIGRAEEAGEAFGRIVGDLERLAALIADVAETSAQQARVAAELDGGARAVTGLARSTVGSSGELGRAIDEVRAAGDRVGAATVTTAGGPAAAASASALEAITADLAPFFALVHQQAGYFYAVYEEATARRGGTILLADLDQLNPIIHGALRRFGDSILGTGVAPARDVLADQPLWVHWWFEGSSGPELPHYDFDPSSPDYYNYPTHEWFQEPATRREPYIAGPYFDDGGMNAFLITLTAPVVREGRVIGVATADVRVDQLDRLCQPHLRRVGRRAALVNAAGRVVACTDHAWANPGSELEPTLAEWCARSAGEPWTVGEGGQTFARSPTLPWGLLVSA